MSGFTVNYNNSISNVDFNDLYLDINGNLSFVDIGDNEIIETCYHAIQLCIGDYDFNTLTGIPYNKYLRSNAPIGNNLKLSVTRQLKNVSGVAKISSFNMQLGANRLLNISFTVNLINGRNINIAIPVNI